jgi:hypothetical protein
MVIVLAQMECCLVVAASRVVHEGTRSYVHKEDHEIGVAKYHNQVIFLPIECSYLFFKVWVLLPPQG